MKIYLSILMVWCGYILHAQHTLSGKVTDTNNKPLIGADIYAPKLHKGTVTDMDGNYTFKSKNELKIVENYYKDSLIKKDELYGEYFFKNKKY